MMAPMQPAPRTFYHQAYPNNLPKTPSPKRRRQMAEVMQPLASPSSMSMLPSRTSSSDAQPYQQAPRPSQTPRSSSTYRATASAPVQTYAFQSTPNLRQDTRTSPTSATHTQKSNASTGHPSTSSSSPASSISTPRNASKEDLTRPHSIISLSSSVPDLSLGTFDLPSPVKASPDRYRRGSSKKNEPPTHTPTAPSGSGMSSAEHLYIPPPVTPVITRTASDDVSSGKNSEAAKRYKRRSMASLDNVNASSTTSTPTYAQMAQHRPASSHGSTSTPTISTVRPVSHHSRHSSADSTKAASTLTPSQDVEESSRNAPSSPVRGIRKDTSPNRAANRSAADASKRINAPSPLSRSAFSNENAVVQDGAMPKSPPKQHSQAAQQLAALSDKDLNKGMKSRLRRAFSFGSAAELRKASAPRAANENIAPTRPAQAGEGTDELDAEQQEIVKRQEAAGIGAGIYSGQGGFSGSTDNLSISSTASSASVMLRKMGKGMKKGGRSLKGLFRPKSVIGVPAADGPIQPSLAEVSMVTVEAERQRVNVNADVASQVGGATGYPKLERNSMEITIPTSEPRSSAERNDSLRKSIVGTDKERAEVLAAVKKGILKRNGTSSPQASPVIRAQNPTFTDAPTTSSPASSLPGTPKDERKSRSLSSTTSSNNDYFSPRLTVNTRSMPATPQSSRNISFSPRIQFHDVWSSAEYDRRGEIATCNRLTPMLAQQIKEELNTFKMEMEVHEQSKPHTHFF